MFYIYGTKTVGLNHVFLKSRLMPLNILQFLHWPTSSLDLNINLWAIGGSYVSALGEVLISPIGKPTD